MLTIGLSTLGEFGLGAGTIGPENRSDIDNEVYREMLEAISNGEFNIPVDDTVPVICVDGRTIADGTRLTAPSIAGATNGIAYSRELSGTGEKKYDDELASIDGTISTLHEAGHRTSVHGDNHSSCGCGACAKAEEIFTLVSTNMDGITKAASAIGVELSEQDKGVIETNARKRLNGFFVDDRSETLVAGVNAGAEKEDLIDEHNELAVVINTVEGTTIDRAAIREKFGYQYDAFVVDAWSFANAAKVFNVTGYEEEDVRLTKAMVVFNIATAGVLAHGSTPVVPVAA